MTTPFFSDRLYKIFFYFLGFIYLLGLSVPLMDNDSAHHANIALRMHLTGDYVNLVDYGKDYLDKPHLHFWLAAWSYKLFGVTTFAYKFPSFLFTILGVYSTYRLGKLLISKEAGKLAALIIASAFAFILANNDVRMEAILTASIAFATWQLVLFVQTKKISAVAGAALGLALGFCTKGHIGVFVPAIGTFIYILYLKDWKIFINWRWLVLLLLFAIFISPVVYCYYLQFNLHPDKIVRGKDHIDGVKFILLNQSVERFGGEMGADAKHDYFFFLHSFLWAFAPWSILAYIAFGFRLRSFVQRKEEWLTAGTFAVMILVISFSGFKLPHYLNITFPIAAVMTAWFILFKQVSPKWIRAIFAIQMIVSVLLLIVSAIINAWAFPVNSVWIVVGLILFLAFVLYFIKREMAPVQKAIAVSVATMLLVFYLLNSNFYPQLLKYQGGNELAFSTRNKVDPSKVYFWKETYSSSYNFYTRTLRQQFSDSVFNNNQQVYLLFDIKSEEEIKASGYSFGQRFEVPDYEITKLDLKFMDPKKRESQCTRMVLAELKGRGTKEQPVTKLTE